MNTNVDESNRVYTFNFTDFISHKWYIVNISHRQILHLTIIAGHLFYMVAFVQVI